MGARVGAYFNLLSANTAFYCLHCRRRLDIVANTYQGLAETSFGQLVLEPPHASAGVFLLQATTLLICVNKNFQYAVVEIFLDHYI